MSSGLLPVKIFVWWDETTGKDVNVWSAKRDATVNSNMSYIATLFAGAVDPTVVVVPTKLPTSSIRREGIIECSVTYWH
jgi:hypothetical protein